MGIGQNKLLLNLCVNQKKTLPFPRQNVIKEFF